MPDTERYRQWVERLAASDRVLVQLVALAALAVLAWELLRRLPEPWRARLRLLYLAGALGTALTAERGLVNTWVLMIGAAVLSAAAVIVGAMIRRMKDEGGRMKGEQP